MRSATGLALLTSLVAGLPACTDLRDYRGTWSGGDATLVLDEVDSHGIAGTIALPGGNPAQLRMSDQIEGDLLTTMTHAGSPLHVYLSYFDPGDLCGEALAVISLYENRRLELRVLRGAGSCAELYAVYPLAEVP